MIQIPQRRRSRAFRNHDAMVWDEQRVTETADVFRDAISRLGGGGEDVGGGEDIAADPGVIWI
jgi:hypothetical protein